MSRSIAVISGKGGVGKSVTAVNLSYLLARAGKSVVLVDCDLGNPSVGLHLGFASPQTGLQEVLTGKRKARDAIVIHSTSGLRVLPASLKYAPSASLSNLKRVLGELKEYDFTVIDSPPGITAEVKDVIEACDEVLVVITPDVPGVTSAAKIIKLCKQHDTPVRGLLVNRVMGEAYELRKHEIESVCETPILCEIPEDEHVPASISSRTPVVAFSPRSPASLKFKQLAAILSGEGAEQFERGNGVAARFTARFSAFFNRFLGLIGLRG